MKHLFICGAARTGTTLLAKILGSNPNVVMGIERYKNLVSSENFDQSLFSMDRFFDFRATDSNVGYTNNEAYYESARSKFKNALYVGDKIPNMYKQLKKVSSTFGDSAMFIFCYRNPYDVASSWNARANNPRDSWPESNDYKKAIESWTQSFKHALLANKAGATIIPFNYDSFVETNKTRGLNYYLKLLEQLGIAAADTDLAALEQEFKRAPVLRKKRQQLNPEMVEFVDSNINQDMLLNFIKTFKCGKNGMPESVQAAWTERLRSRAK